MATSLVFRLHPRGPELVREVLLERGWEEFDGQERGEGDWNLYWRGSAFPSWEYTNLLPWQRLNHHPKTVGITRKDYLVRNLRRMSATWGSSLYDFSPNAFILPNDYIRFLSEYKKVHVSQESSVFWICKPVDLSRGRGIFIFQDIKDLVYDCPVIVQRYISDPLLISGYKFDLRIYVCVKSFHPLTVYIHQEGLVRFATEKYDLSSLQNLYAHLTNTSINKLGPFYKSPKGRVGQGCKWTLSKFRHFLQSQEVHQPLLWQRINNIVTLTLLTIAPFVPSCPNCVELFGFDVLLDAKFKPWLLEVNYSPALTLDCQVDIMVKKGLVGDLIDLMNYTSVDGLREGAFQNRKHHQPRYHADLRSHVPVPLLSKFKEAKVQKTTGNLRHSQTRALPWLKIRHESIETNQMPPRRHVFATHLPPVVVNRACAARGRTVTRAQPDKTLDLTLNLRSRRMVSKVNELRCPELAPWQTDDRRLHDEAEVTNPDTGETITEVVSSGISDIPQRGVGFRCSNESWKLPNIYSQVPVKTPRVRTSPQGKPQVPPLRVGGFVRTFPFNRVTLNASQNKLDVKSVVQELHKLTAQLVSSQSDRMTSAGEEEEEESRTETEGEEEFESLFWGLTNPRFISQCVRTATKPRQ